MSSVRSLVTFKRCLDWVVFLQINSEISYVVWEEREKREERSVSKECSVCERNVPWKKVSKNVMFVVINICHVSIELSFTDQLRDNRIWSWKYVRCSITGDIQLVNMIKTNEERGKFCVKERPEERGTSVSKNVPLTLPWKKVSKNVPFVLINTCYVSIELSFTDQLRDNMHSWKDWQDRDQPWSKGCV